jgi:hypothetical protein
MIQLKLNWFGGQGLFADTSLIKNGQKLNIDIRGTNANWNLRTDEISKIIDRIKEKGALLTDAELLTYIDQKDLDSDLAESKIKNIQNAQKLLVNNNPEYFGFTAEGGSIPTLGSGISTTEDGKVSALNQYYQDVYSLAPGTGGAEMLGRLEQSYANQAQQAATLADVQFQQSALQQAQTVKAITDQVRSERMARLRAGMSESQIANQDMQMLMANVNTLNQNAQMLNQARLEAQTGMNLAQDQAYQDYLAQANQRGQVASAMAASDAGDAYQQTIRQMTTLYGNDPTKWTASQWSTISNQVTGQNQNK